MSEPLHIRLVEDLAGFERLRPVWTDLVSRCRPSFVFMTWEWCYTWWRYFAGDRKLYIIVLFRGQDPIAIVPLMRHYSRSGSYHHQHLLLFIGFRFEQRWNDWMDFPSVEKAVAIPAVLRFLAARQHLWDMIDLWDIPEESDTLLHLKQAATELHLPFFLADRNVCPYVRTVGNWDDYFREGVSRELRDSFSWKIPRLLRRGPIELYWTSNNNVKKHLAALFELRDRRQAARCQPNMFAEKTYQEFYISLAAQFQMRHLDCTLLTVGGVPAAAHFGFRYNGKLYWCTPGFNPTMKAYSPGAILLKRMLQQCFADPAISDFDFLRGNEQYKYDWATGERYTQRITIRSPYTLVRAVKPKAIL
jgi:CelD/BcsL family acetyltransferase involved in cellulose biosynthesis